MALKNADFYSNVCNNILKNLYYLSLILKSLVFKFCLQNQPLIIKLGTLLKSISYNFFNFIYIFLFTKAHSCVKNFYLIRLSREDQISLGNKVVKYNKIAFNSLK